MLSRHRNVQSNARDQEQHRPLIVLRRLRHQLDGQSEGAPCPMSKLVEELRMHLAWRWFTGLLRHTRLGVLQAQIAAVSDGSPTRRKRSWKRGLSRKPSMPGSV
jgi:hypothetical protein